MKNKAIIRIAATAILGVISIVLSFKIYGSIMAKDHEIAQIKMADDLVIQKLKKIREAQKLYFDVNKTYARDWSDLQHFLKTGQVAITQVKEKITLVNGQEEVEFITDTLSIRPAIDVMEETAAFKATDIETIAVVPLSDTLFDLYANKLQGFYVVEVSDPAPINPRRQEKGDLKPLRIGSKAAATLKGNWE